MASRQGSLYISIGNMLVIASKSFYSKNYKEKQNDGANDNYKMKN